MPSLRPLGHLLLALALVANGLVADGMAVGPFEAEKLATASPPGDDHAGCHEAEPATPAQGDQAPHGAPMKCCDGTRCTCACLQHAPAVLWTFALPELERFSPPAVLGTLVTWPSAPTAPPLRPPIA